MYYIIIIRVLSEISVRKKNEILKINFMSELFEEMTGNYNTCQCFCMHFNSLGQESRIDKYSRVVTRVYSCYLATVRVVRVYSITST